MAQKWADISRQLFFLSIVYFVVLFTLIGPPH
jgi:hypothetical protein